MIGSIDTCFLIDWARYRRREMLERMFEYIYVTEDVLAEIYSDTTLEYVSETLARGFLVIYPFRREAEPIVRRAVELSARDPRIPVLDPPEAFALAIACREGGVCLTENRGVLLLVRYYEEFREVEVWRSLELLEYAHRIHLVKDLEGELEAFSEDTGHVFPKKESS